MPDMDGFAVLQQIRRDSIIRNTRVLMLSSASSRENAARRGGAAAVSFLLKPVRKRDLLQALRTTLASEVANDVAESSPSNWLQHADDKRCAGLRILLAEDNRINQKVVIGILQKRGHTISLVGDGKEAIAALALASFDLVLMDVHMPVMDGFQAIALIRHAEVTTGIHVPVIALTANAMKGDRERCLAAGFDDYVSKPIRFLELIDAVARAAQSDSGIESGWRREPTVPLPLDWSIVLRLVGDDQQTLREICRLFVRDYAEMMQDIGQAIDRTDVAALQHAIHALIGSIGYFGSADATAAARNVDEIAHSNDLTGVRQAFLELRNILDRIVPEIKNHLAMAS
jgi:CheY-like chemotaxis protein/HPt (histidine-containing phosphotransfer) domain-containing protein